MYISGYVKIHGSAWKRLEEIGIAAGLKYSSQAGGFDSFTIPDEFSDGFNHRHGTSACCGNLWYEPYSKEDEKEIVGF